MALLEPEVTLGGDGESVYVDEVLLKTRSENGEIIPIVVLGMRDHFFLKLVIVETRSQERIFSCIKKYVHPDSLIVTDKWSGYLSLARHNWRHTMIDHSREWKNADGYTHTNIDGVFSHVRRFLHNNIDRRNIWMFLAHFQFIFNRRNDRRQCFLEMISRFPIIDEEKKKLIAARTDLAFRLPND